MTDASETAPEEDAAAAPADDWRKIDGFSPDATSFPVRGLMGRTGVLVFRTKDGFRGTAVMCPHLRASLHDAVLMANTTVLRCSQHNFTFKMSTGQGVNSPSYRLPVFEIKIEDGVAYGRAAN